jgi:hypothetical protein
MCGTTADRPNELSGNVGLVTLGATYSSFLEQDAVYGLPGYSIKNKQIGQLQSQILLAIRLMLSRGFLKNSLTAVAGGEII